MKRKLKRAAASLLALLIMGMSCMSSYATTTDIVDEVITYLPEPDVTLPIVSNYEAEYGISTYGAETMIIGQVAGLICQNLLSGGGMTYSKVTLSNLADGFMQEMQNLFVPSDQIDFVTTFAKCVVGGAFSTVMWKALTGLDWNNELSQYMDEQVKADSSILNSSYVSYSSLQDAINLFPESFHSVLDDAYSYNSSSQSQVINLLNTYEGRYALLSQSADSLYIYVFYDDFYIFPSFFSLSSLTLSYNGSGTRYPRLFSFAKDSSDHWVYRGNGSGFYLDADTLCASSRYFATNVLYNSRSIFPNYSNYFNLFSCVPVAPSMSTTYDAAKARLEADDIEMLPITNVDKAYEQLDKAVKEAGATGLTAEQVKEIVSQAIKENTYAESGEAVKPTEGETEGSTDVPIDPPSGTTAADDVGAGSVSTWFPAITKQLDNIWTGVQSIPVAIAGLLDQVKSIPQTIADSFAQEATETQDQYAVNSIIKDKFPFCVPFDLVDCFRNLQATSIEPRWELPFEIKSINFKYVFVLDLSTSEWSTLVTVVRSFVLLFYIAFLVSITRTLIKG